MSVAPSESAIASARLRPKTDEVARVFMVTIRSLAKRYRAATLSAFALCITLFWVSSAQAQGAARPRVELPVAVSDTRVDYPAGATGDAQVVLELVIGEDGQVERVDVITGDEPFASTARRAAKEWTFRPAKRGDTPLRAKIRFQVLFSEPAAEPAPDPDPAPRAATPEAPPAPRTPKAATTPDAIDVVVEGERSDTSKRMTRAEVRQLPGAFGDPFRAIEVLPGVTPIASGLPYFFVRGAPPGNVGYFFDDIPVPGLYHVAAGPAVIHPAFVDDVRLYSGAFPARFGRFAGAVVAGTAAAPQYRFRGEANLRLIDSGALVEAPFDDARGSVMVAGRYSYTAVLVSLIAPEVDVAYWDYQGRVQYRLTERDTVSLFGFGSYDFLRAEDDDGEMRDIYDVTFHRYDLRYDRTLSSTSAVRLATTLAFDRTAAGQRVDLVANRVRNRVHYTDQMSKRVKLQVGADVDIARYSIFLDRDGPDDDDGLPGELDPRPLPGLPPRQLPQLPNDETLEDLFSSRNEVTTGAWLEWTLGLGAGVTLTPGFRLDAYAGDGVTLLAPEPRISARFQLSPRVALLHDLGIAHQPPSFAIPVPGLSGRASRGLQRGVQTSAGTEVELGAEVTGTFTLFQTALFGGTDPLSLFQLQRADPTVDNDEDRSIAHTYGLEVMLRRPLSERIGGFASYTLSRSTRSAGRLHGPSSFDRTHVVNLALAYELGRNWRAGWRGVFYSGIPAEVAYARAARRPPRTDPYYRLDLRLEKRWRLGETGFWALVFEVLNATLNKETLDRSCYAYGCSDDDIGPITIPSIGLEASF